MFRVLCYFCYLLCNARVIDDDKQTKKKEKKKKKRKEKTARDLSLLSSLL